MATMGRDFFALEANKEGKYGDVDYADTKNKKYPIDTPKHIRAAWNYIHVKKNAKKYSKTELKQIKDRIIKAWKKKIDKAGPPEARHIGKEAYDETGTLDADGFSTMMDNATDVIDVGMASMESVNRYIKLLRTDKDRKETTLNIIKLSTESIVRNTLVSYESKVIAVESANSTLDEKYGIALETLGDVLTAIWEAIKGTVSFIWEQIKALFRWIFGLNNESKIEKNIKENKELEKKHPELTTMTTDMPEIENSDLLQALNANPDGKYSPVTYDSFKNLSKELIIYINELKSFTNTISMKGNSNAISSIHDLIKKKNYVAALSEYTTVDTASRRMEEEKQKEFSSKLKKVSLSKLKTMLKESGVTTTTLPDGVEEGHESVVIGYSGRFILLPSVSDSNATKQNYGKFQTYTLAKAIGTAEPKSHYLPFKTYTSLAEEYRDDYVKLMADIKIFDRIISDIQSDSKTAEIQTTSILDTIKAANTSTTALSEEEETALEGLSALSKSRMTIFKNAIDTITAISRAVTIAVNVANNQTDYLLEHNRLFSIYGEKLEAVVETQAPNTPHINNSPIAGSINMDF